MLSRSIPAVNEIGTACEEVPGDVLPVRERPALEQPARMLRDKQVDSFFARVRTNCHGIAASLLGVPRNLPSWAIVGLLVSGAMPAPAMTKAGVKGGVKRNHQGGAKVDHFGPLCGVG